MNTVLVTGANRGVGLSLVEQLLSKGWQVHATYRSDDSADKLKSLADKGDLICHRLDITDYAAVSSLVDVLPSLDLLINNADITDQKVTDLATPMWKSGVRYSKLIPSLRSSWSRRSIQNCS